MWLVYSNWYNGCKKHIYRQLVYIMVIRNTCSFSTISSYQAPVHIVWMSHSKYLNMYMYNEMFIRYYRYCFKDCFKMCSDSIM